MFPAIQLLIIPMTSLLTNSNFLDCTTWLPNSLNFALLSVDPCLNEFTVQQSQSLDILFDQLLYQLKRNDDIILILHFELPGMDSLYNLMQKVHKSLTTM